MEIRRSDRALDEKIGLEIIDKCEYAVLSCIDDDNIFSIPISIARKGNSIFIHGAKGGSKSKLFKDGRKVELVCVSYNKVPTHSKEFLEEIKDDHKKLGSKVFTTEYNSAIAKTLIYEVKDDKLKIDALKILCEKYTPQYMEAFKVAAFGSLNITNIYELKIQSITAKAKKI